MRTKAFVGWVAFFVALASIWWFILPPALSGRTTLFITKGISMEPYIHQDDLAVLHKKKHYVVGDVVAYYAPAIRATTLHRIISIDAKGNITTKGDNNDFTDNDHPTQKQVIGRIDHIVPGGGRYVTVLTLWPVRVIGIALMAWAAYGIFRGKLSEPDENENINTRFGSAKRRARRMAGRTGLTQRSGGSPIGGSRGFADAVTRLNLSGLAGAPDDDGGNHVSGGPSGSANSSRPASHMYVMTIGTALALIAAGVLISTLLTKPPTTAEGTSKLIYTLQGKWDYTADAGPNAGDVYPTGTLSTGDPIYLAMIDKVKLTYAFSIGSPNKFAGHGTFKLDAVVKGKSGWSRVIPLVTTTDFTGGHITVDTSVDLAETRRIVAQAQALTKISEGDYTIAFKPTVVVDGTLGRLDFNDALASELDFNVSRQIMTVSASPTTGANNPVPTETDTPASNFYGLTPSKGGTIDLPATSITSLTVDNKKLDLSTVRLAMGVVLALSLGAITLSSKRRTELDNAADVLAEAQEHFQKMFTSVSSYSPSATSVVSLSTLADLASLAESYAEPVLRRGDEVAETFFFTHENVCYEYSRTFRVVPTAAQRFGVPEDNDAPAAAQSSATGAEQP